MFCVAVAVDLLTKTIAVAGGDVLIYNERPNDLPVRLAVCAVTLAVVLALDAVGRRRGVGRLWGAWACVGLLLGGTLSNGVSPHIWAQGVPDFIRMRDGWVWNVADFEIGLGLMGTAVSLVASAALAYARGRRAAGQGARS